jgi:sugar phosphate isomerase/epimerase
VPSPAEGRAARPALCLTIPRAVARNVPDFVILKEEGIGKSDNGRLEEMAGHMGGKMYVVYEGRARHLSPDDAEIIWTTEDWQEALDRATAHQGVVYVYDVTDQEEFIHETFAYDGTHS